MKISVQKVYERGFSDINEDELLVSDNLFAVFDGASSSVKYKDSKGRTGGKIAAQIAKETFSSGEGTLKELAIKANNKLREEMIESGVDISDKLSLWITSVAAVRLDKDSFDYVQTSDSLILVVYGDGSYKLITENYNHDLETLKIWKKLAEQKPSYKILREKIKSQNEENRKKVNIDYGGLSGEEEAIRFLKTGRISLKDVKSLILFTDGLFIPKEDPESPVDWALFVRLYQEQGLKGLFGYVRDIQKKDPDCWEYPRLKPQDDVAAIGIDFE